MGFGKLRASSGYFDASILCTDGGLSGSTQYFSTCWKIIRRDLAFVGQKCVTTYM
jgi:hypothetical protein